MIFPYLVQNQITSISHTQFFDGWELNEKVFPNANDHHLPMNERVHEFCNHLVEWPFRHQRKTFRSSQNAALLQYRIPTSGSFVASVKFHDNPERKLQNFHIQN